MPIAPRTDVRALYSTIVIAALLSACDGDPSLPPPGDGEGLLPPGRACTADPQCQNGWCVEYPAGPACAALCAGVCGAGLSCKRADGRDPTSVAICVPSTSSLCLPCSQDSDCGTYGDICLPRDGSFFCGSDCTETQLCPEGFECRSVQEGGLELSRQCVPLSGTCTCSAVNDGLKRPCVKTVSGIGTCQGEETCVVGSGWVSCDARTPIGEICDNQDNDCDGHIDEALNGAPLQKPCGYGDPPRRQECEGVESCDTGVWSSCSALLPYSEEYFCDGLDDDCNGDADDGLLKTPDHCSMCDDECPPGSSLDYSTERSCLDSGSIFYCGPIKCRVPYYDVNDDANDGCEIEDDHISSGSVQLNDAWWMSFEIGPGDGAISCSDGDTVTSCGLRLPSDGRVHVPSDPVGPIDYHHFLMTGGMCTVDTWICAYFSQSATYADTEIDICWSGTVPNLMTTPSFDLINDCTSLVLGATDRVAIPVSVNRDDYLYVSVERVGGGHYGGIYAISAFDSAGQCPLDVAADPCTY